MSRTIPTLRRALTLDPNLEDATAQIVSLDTDAGKLPQAYQEAWAMTDKRPQSGFAHFTLSYVLRYAGLSQEAADERNTAVRLDPPPQAFTAASLVMPHRRARGSKYLCFCPRFHSTDEPGRGRFMAPN